MSRAIQLECVHVNRSETMKLKMIYFEREKRERARKRERGGEQGRNGGERETMGWGQASELQMKFEVSIRRTLEKIEPDSLMSV